MAVVQGGGRVSFVVAVVCAVVCAVVVCSCFATGASSAVAINNRPIIGVLSQPTEGGWTPDPKLNQYIAASYIKWIEAGGARTVPLKWDTPAAQQLELISKLNGVVFPGGGVDMDHGHPYYKAIVSIFDGVKKLNDAGKYLPMWGTCFGFQELSILGSGGADILFPVDAENYTISLNLTAAANASRLLGGASKEIINILTQQRVTMNNHRWGVKPDTYNTNSQLRDTFTVLSTNTDRRGQVFASTIEGKKYPFYATQWHPEKIQFEWNPYEVIDHSAESIIANRYTAEFFVGEARKSPNRFATDAEADNYLIYHYSPTYTFPHIHDFEQSYFF